MSCKGVVTIDAPHQVAHDKFHCDNVACDVISFVFNTQYRKFIGMENWQKYVHDVRPWHKQPTHSRDMRVDHAQCIRDMNKHGLRIVTVHDLMS